MPLFQLRQLAALLLLLLSTTVHGISSALPETDKLFSAAAKAHNVPEAVLRSICHLESKGNPWAVNINGIGFQPNSKKEALTLIEQTQRRPWVLTLKYKGQAAAHSFFKTKQAAKNALNEIYNNNHRWYLKNPKSAKIRKLDMRSVDLGMMQINHLFHGRHFESKEALFDPKTNIFYAAKYLRKLIDRHGTIKASVAHYHSNTHKYQTIYLSHFWPIYHQIIRPNKKA